MSAADGVVHLRAPGARASVCVSGQGPILPPRGAYKPGGRWTRPRAKGISSRGSGGLRPGAWGLGGLGGHTYSQPSILLISQSVWLSMSLGNTLSLSDSVSLSPTPSVSLSVSRSLFLSVPLPLALCSHPHIAAFLTVPHTPQLCALGSCHTTPHQTGSDRIRPDHQWPP